MLKLSKQINIWSTETFILLGRSRINQDVLVFFPFRICVLNDTKEVGVILIIINPIHRTMNLVEVHHILHRLILVNTDIHTL